MTNVYVVVEGKSEQAFVQQVLAVDFANRDICLEAVLVGKPGHKGGNRWPVARTDIVNLLKMGRPHRRVCVTTMFDYYAMPVEWPGRSTVATLAREERAASVEMAIAADIASAFDDGFDPARFVPYVQIHEFETLIFADPGRLSEEFPDRADQIAQLVASVAGIAPEDINDTPAGAPSKRIIDKIPEYASRKSSAGPDILKLAGLPTLSARCPHFALWLARMESLATQ